MTADAIVAPTDAQLAYIRDLCDRNGFQRPEFGCIVSHEWNCRCPRCERDALLDTPDDDRAEQEADELEAVRYGARTDAD